MRKSLLSLAMLALTAGALSAQRVENYGLELRPYVGAYVPLTSHRYDFRDAPTYGAQAAYELGDYLHVVGTFGWTDAKTRIGLSRDNVHLYSYDVGAEANLFYEIANGWFWRPFVGAGGGGRTYDYEGTVASRTCAAGYGAIGTEMQRSVVAFRVEARDYLNCFESPMTGKKKTRNDAMFTLGVAFHLR